MSKQKIKIKQSTKKKTGMKKNPNLKYISAECQLGEQIYNLRSYEKNFNFVSNANDSSKS